MHTFITIKGEGTDSRTETGHATELMSTIAEMHHIPSPQISRHQSKQKTYPVQKNPFSEVVFASSRGARPAREGSDGRSTGGGAAAAFAGLVAAATRAAAAAPAAPRGRRGGGRGGGGGRDRFMRRANTTIARLRKFGCGCCIGEKGTYSAQICFEVIDEKGAQTQSRNLVSTRGELRQDQLLSANLQTNGHTKSGYRCNPYLRKKPLFRVNGMRTCEGKKYRRDTTIQP